MDISHNPPPQIDWALVKPNINHIMSGLPTELQDKIWETLIESYTTLESLINLIGIHPNLDQCLKNVLQRRTCLLYRTDDRAYWMDADDEEPDYFLGFDANRNDYQYLLPLQSTSFQALSAFMISQDCQFGCLYSYVDRLDIRSHWTTFKTLFECIDTIEYHQSHINSW
ncbi:unnamed protein product [Ambrosiozyma monospora]|uniref:Unnamed protein product n=1 Tax=Ambrosiozyma monospora TaxID=43982 RepID=A0ACB5SW76_AMBMO|nr:unnamed protein product [Ambrosiozyma monospora]